MRTASFFVPKEAAREAPHNRVLPVNGGAVRERIERSTDASNFGGDLQMAGNYALLISPSEEFGGVGIALFLLLRQLIERWEESYIDHRDRLERGDEKTTLNFT